MGFGLLFFGYILAFFFNLSSVYFFADIIGGCIMMWALYRLAAYEKGYLRAAVATIAYTVVCFVSAMLMLLSVKTGAAAEYILASVKITAVILVHTFMLTATEKMCRRAELPRHAVKAKRNLVVTYIYCVLDLAVTFIGDSLGEMMGAYMSVAVTIFGLVWLFSVAFLIFRCFQLICEAGDEEAKPAPTKTKFGKVIDKMAEKIINQGKRDGGAEDDKK